MIVTMLFTDNSFIILSFMALKPPFLLDLD